MEVSELPVPEPGPGEVRIRVAAATVNPTDIGFRTGRQLNAAQLAEMGVKPPYVPGMELVGVVDAVGAGAPWRVGDRVMAIVNPRRPGGGAQAEQVVVPSASVARVPEGTSLERVRVSAYFENQAALEQLARLVAGGRLTLRVARTFPPEEAASAQETLAAGGTRGRLLIAF